MASTSPADAPDSPDAPDVPDVPAVSEEPGPRSVADHLHAILNALAPLPPYEQPLLDALGLPVAEDVTSPIALPRFTNSAMDGYAVRHRDVAGARPERPIHLPVVGESAAGASRAFALTPGTAMKIMTGAALPSGADTVVPLEATDRGVANVVITSVGDGGEHVRTAGEDIGAGEILVADGQVLGPRQVGLLASVGRANVLARPRPRVVILSTGTELREPGERLDYDSIYDGNSYTLAAAVRDAGALPFRVGIVSDDPDEFSDALSDQLVRADAIVTSGGVSKGDYDVVKDVLGKLGSVHFTEVAMQPGKPQGFGFVGEDSTPIFCLPGNPVSAYVSFEVFVVPALRRLMGRLPYGRPLTQATVLTDVVSPLGRQQFVRVHFDQESTAATVRPVGGHGSHLVGGLSAANALMVIPADSTSVSAGESVDVMVLDRAY